LGLPPRARRKGWVLAMLIIHDACAWLWSRGFHAFVALHEEFELQFIDGDHIDCDLARAWRIKQANIGPYFDAVENWDDHDKRVFIIAVGEAGYSFDLKTVSASDFDVDIYRANSMKGLAEEFVADGLFGEIPDHLTHYIDYEAIAHDLAMDYTETEVAGEYLIYRAG